MAFSTEGLVLSQRSADVTSFNYRNAFDSYVTMLRELRETLAREYDELRAELNEKVEEIYRRNGDWREKYELTEENQIRLEALKEDHWARLEARREEFQAKLDAIVPQ